MPYTPNLANIRARVRMIAKFEQAFKHPITELLIQNGRVIAIYEQGSQKTLRRVMTDNDLLDYENYLVAKVRNTSDELRVFVHDDSLENRIRKWQADLDRLHKILKDLKEKVS